MKNVNNLIIRKYIDYTMYTFVIDKTDAAQIRVDHFKFYKSARDTINDLVMSLDYDNLLIVKYMIENGNKMGS